MSQASQKANAPHSHAAVKAQFRKLSAQCVKADVDFVDAGARIHGQLAQAYALFHDLQQQPSILTAIYKREKIKKSGRESASKFTPFLKVLFRLDLPNPTPADISRYNLTPQSMKNRVSHYAAVLDILDREYAARPNDFTTKRELKFRKIIEDNGGLIGATRTRANDNQPLKARIVAKQIEDDIAVSRNWISDNAVSLLKTTIIGSAYVVNSVKFGPSGTVACVLSKAAGGKIEIKAASNDNAIIQAIGVEQASRLSQVADHSLRQLGEVTATQSFPGQFCPDGSRFALSGKYRSFYEDIYLDESDVPDAGAACRRLVIRNDDILLSALRTKASVTTILKPSRPLLTSKDFPVYLDLDQLRLIEDWLETGTIGARTATPSASLGKPTNGHAALRVLDVKNSATGKNVKLKFNRLGGTAGHPATTYQPDFNAAGFTPNWSFLAGGDWFEVLRDKLLTPWFSRTVSGNKLKRPEHWLFKVKVTTANFVIGFELDGDSGVNPEEKMDFPTPAKLQRACQFQVSTKDFAPVLYNLTNLDLEGDVEVAGDNDVIVLKFRTALGEYVIAIPTAKITNNKVERSRSHRMLAYS